MAYGTLAVDTLNSSTGVLASNNGMTGIAKAWVNFVGSSGAINQSFNVSSVTRNATGDYTVNYTTAMPNANYVLAANGQLDTSGAGNSAVGIYRTSGAQTASTVRIASYGCSTGTLTDFVFVQVVIFSA